MGQLFNLLAGKQSVGRILGKDFGKRRMDVTCGEIYPKGRWSINEFWLAGVLGACRGEGQKTASISRPLYQPVPLSEMLSMAASLS